MYFRGKYAFCSNFYKCNGLLGPSVEHDWQAAKHTDPVIIAAILGSDNPKREERKYRQYRRQPLPNAGVAQMRLLIRCKFDWQSNPELCRRLLETGDEPLVEDNWWHDNFWGNCLCAICAGELGENVLGRLLMVRREQLREELPAR